ncbi:MAG TPA: sulfate ABC transporter substrate-binding protein [Acidobacteriota bacterium]
MKRDKQAKTTSLLAATAMTFLLCFASCAKSGPGNGSRVTLILGAYTTPREAYSKAIIPSFKQVWKSNSGQDVEFQASYQGSGSQVRAIIGGFEADVAALSLSEDIDKIQQAGLIHHDWKSKPHGGMATRSIVVIAVRPGNPKGIKDWPDLAKPGLNILTPDPKTSGGAMWNINAIYGAALRGHAGVAANNAAAAEQFLKSVFKNVTVMDKGARESITNFERGVGDAAITYENEVLVGQAAGQKYEYIVPRSTILIENPVALVDQYVDKHGTRKAADEFLNYLWSKEAQRAFTKFGLRPVDPDVEGEAVSQFRAVEDLWKIDYLGGWKKVISDIFGPQGVYSRMHQELHQSK